VKTRSANFLLEKDLKWENLGNGATRQIMGYDGQLMLVKAKFEKGAAAPQHEHFHSQSTYVVSGKFEVTINGETKILAAGDGFYVEPDVVHRAVCLEAGILVDAFSPMRETFIKT
jgi:quercetin dioxygenase-like cupin family protein